MFSIKLFLYVNLISLILAQLHHNAPDDNEIIIDPLELVLRSNATQGSFYCNSRVKIKEQQNKLMVSIDHPILTTPTFQLETKQMNETTIRIDIVPQGYIGVNRISCHWDNNITYGQTADLIIGDYPGVIQLKETCRAFDRRYVQCIFRAPTIARAFRNGFSRLYKFWEINSEILSYRDSPKLINITDNNELVFHFEPRDRHTIPKKTPMGVNMTLRRFNTSTYLFNIQPVHTTQVDFQLGNHSCEQLTIHINHNSTGTTSQRFCFGSVNKVDNQGRLTEFRDIIETTDQNILIKGLHSSKNYSICLRCYYNKTDESFKEEKCIMTTTPGRIKCYPVRLIAAVAIGVICILVIIGIVYRRRCTDRTLCKRPEPRRDSNDFELEHLNNTTGTIDNQPPEDYTYPRYHLDEEPVDDPLIPPNNPEQIDDEGSGKYQPLSSEVFIDRLDDKYNISPDTKDLTKRNNI